MFLQIWAVISIVAAIITRLIAIWQWTAIAASAALITLIITIWARSKPLIDVYFENGKKDLASLPNVTITLKFIFENCGRRFLICGIKKKEAAQDLSIMIYFPMHFKIEWAERQREKTSRIFISSQKGQLTNRQYIFVPDPLERKPPVMTSLRFKEVEECFVRIRTPNVIGEYEIGFDMACRQGDLCFKKLILRINPCRNIISSPLLQEAINAQPVAAA
jgi:hypothetical protein